MQRSRHNFFFFFFLTSSLTAFISPCKKTRRCVPLGRWKRKRRSSLGSEYWGWEQEGGGMQSQDQPPPLIVLSPHPGLTGPFLLGSYTRDHPLFLQLKDYFWVKTPSLYELPYGTKGSGKPQQRSLWVSVRPSVPPAAAPHSFQLPSY